MKIPVPLLLCAALAGAAIPAQTWTMISPAPYPNTLQRRAGGFAWHPVAGGLVMYGGLQSGPTLTLSDTQVWNGVTWTPLTTPTAPPPRWGHRMVYDTKRARIVTFGGRSPTTTTNANDTWEFDGTNWIQMFPATSPSARAFYGMAYDERRGKTVIYGVQGGIAPTGQQTWEYDGTTWTQVVTATQPPGLEQPTMGYDKGRGVVVMFGGWNGVSPGTDYRTTWEFDGVDWRLKTTLNAPATGYRASMAYDDFRGRLVFYGGYANSQVQQFTWEYDGNDWTQVGSGGPGRVTEGFMAYLPTMGQTVYFGGSGPTVAGTVNNETWFYVGATTAIAGPYGTGCATSAGVPTLAATSLPVLGTNYQITLNGAPAVSIGLVVHGLDNMELAPGIGLPFDLTPVGIAGCLLEVRPDATAAEVTAGGTFTHVLPLPATPALTGTALFSQVLVFDSAAPNGFGGMSNAVHAVLGQ